MRAEAPRPPCGRTRRMPPRGHLKSRAAAFKGTAGAGRVFCTVRRRGQGHATPQAPRRRSRGDRRRRGPEGHEGRVGAGRPEAQRQDTGGHGATRARGLPGRAATQKCRRAKRLTPAWPPPPSPSAPPSFPGPACRGGDGGGGSGAGGASF